MRKRVMERGGVDEHDEVVARSVNALALPCFLTTATAALGFGTLVAAKVGIIRQFGIDAAVGVKHK